MQDGTRSAISRKTGISLMKDLCPFRHFSTSSIAHMIRFTKESFQRISLPSANKSRDSTTQGEVTAQQQPHQTKV
jgi:hypothetical protein